MTGLTGSASPARVMLLLALLGVRCTVAASDAMTVRSGAAQVALLELYTSEGCSSCPRADRWLSTWAADRRLWRELVPVAFHVDYWDELGWRDALASPRYSERQRHYAAAGGLRTVYTPGFIVDGREWRGWFAGEPLQPRTAVASGVLTLTLDATGRVDLRFAPAGAPPAALRYTLAVLGSGIETTVPRGENAGRVLRHDFAVLGLREGRLAAGAASSTSVDLPQLKHRAPRYALAAWVGPLDTPAPLQAVGTWLPATLTAVLEGMPASD